MFLAKSCVWAVLFFVVLACHVSGEEIAVVRGTALEKASPEGDGKIVGRYVDNVEGTIRAAGLQSKRLTDEDVAAGKLKGFKVAVFPLNSSLAEGEGEAIRRFVESGGKIWFFYGCPEPAASLLGLKSKRFVAQKYDGYYSQMLVKPGIVGGMPDVVTQRSYNAYDMKAVGGAEVLAEWADTDGKRTGIPAIIISPNGAYVSHVLTTPYHATQSKMMFAVMGHLVPSVWGNAMQRSLANLYRFGMCATKDELVERISEPSLPRRQRAQAKDLLDEAVRVENEAKTLVRAGKDVEAYERVERAKGLLRKAYALSFTSRSPEFRAAWLHSPIPLKDDWDYTFKRMQRLGLNALCVNVSSASHADYPSDVLPMSKRAKESGDMVRPMMDAAKRRNIEIHLWMMNFSFSWLRTPEYVEKLKNEGRIALYPDGSPDKRLSLCPSHPDNRKLNRDAMVEMAVKYHPDGVQYDYIRTMGPKSCFCSGCRTTFEKDMGITVQNWPEQVLPTGDYYDKWREWRCSQITRVVRETSAAVRAAAPDVAVSADVFSNADSAYSSVAQDWRTWVDKGLIDLLLPMDYTNDNARLDKLAKYQAEFVAGRMPFYAGLGQFRFRRPEQLAEQIDIARRAGADGFCIFDLPSINDESIELAVMGALAVPARPQYRSPRMSVELPEGLSGKKATYRTGDKITVTVTITPDIVLDGKAARLQANFELLPPADAGDAIPLGRGRARGQLRRTLKVPVQVGRWRIAARVTASIGRRRKRKFLVRGALVIGLSRDEADELEKVRRLRTEPAKPEGPGIRVGVVTDGYGSDSLFALLKAELGLCVFRVYNFLPGTMTVCQVLVLPQQKKSDVLTPEVRKRLVDYVEQGGRLLVTHDAVGFRNHPRLFTPVCKRGTDVAKGTRCSVVAEHPITRGIDVGSTFEHSYYDHIVLEPGERGKVLIADGERPVVVVGESGDGRFVAWGMVTGINKSDSDAAPAGTERDLFVNAVRWMAEDLKAPAE